MPSKTRHKIRPKVKTLPPRIGLSMRYQIISMRKNANPTIAAAGNTNHAGASGFSATALSSDLRSSAFICGELIFFAREITSAPSARLISAANHNVARVPYCSIM